MLKDPICRAVAARRGAERPRRPAPFALAAALSVCAALLAGCAPPGGSDAPTAVASAAPIPPKEALPLDQAAVALADATLLRAELPPPGPSGRYKLVIDPLIDRATGGETEATRAMERRIDRLVRERHPRFDCGPSPRRTWTRSR